MLFQVRLCHRCSGKPDCFWLENGNWECECRRFREFDESGSELAKSKQVVVGSGGCLAGEAAGWTLKHLGKCCAGYIFNALTPEEAYDTYGLAPYVGNADASASIIGVCLDNASNS